MLEDLFFRILTAYSTVWMRNKARVMIEGRENLPRDRTEKRAYIVINHSTSYDLVALMHISASRFSVVMDEGAFNFPVIRRIFNGVGFIPLVKSDSGRAVEAAVAKIRAGIPVINSLTEGGSTMGKEERPRTGGIRIAHLAGASIYPVFTMVEENKKRHLSFKGVDGRTHPFTTFRDTLYFVSFLPPIPASEFGSNETYESYQKVAMRLKELADREQRKYERLLIERRAEFDGIRRRGGATDRVQW
jgi:1-acyl-sn-glycerol-3-phosphate acyltransferase